MSLRERVRTTLGAIKNRLFRKEEPLVSEQQISEPQPQILSDKPWKDSSPRRITKAVWEVAKLAPELEISEVQDEEPDSVEIETPLRRVISDETVLRRWGQRRVEAALRLIPDNFDMVLPQHCPPPVERLLKDVLWVTSNAKLKLNEFDDLTNKQARFAYKAVREVINKRPDITLLKVQTLVRRRLVQLQLKGK